MSVNKSLRVVINDSIYRFERLVYTLYKTPN